MKTIYLWVENEWWKENYKMVCKKQNYSEEQIEEYYGYILICETLQKTIK